MYKGNRIQKVLAHWMPWFARDGKHCEVGYVSNNPYTISRQLLAMKAEGIDGVIATFDGSAVDPQGTLATREMCFQCSQTGMLFALLVNSSMVKFRPDMSVTPQIEVMRRINEPIVQEMLSSSAYVPEKYILEFDLSTLGVDFVALAKTFANKYIFLSKHTGFSWPEITNTLQTLQKDNPNPTMMIPGVCGKIFDGGNPPTGTRDYGVSVWDKTIPARSLASMAGQTYLDQLNLVNQSAKYIGLVTWNDYDEGYMAERSIFQTCAKSVTLRHSG